MRIDDRLQTVLNKRPEGPAAKLAQWRQLVDLLAQSYRHMSDESVDQLVDHLAILGPQIEPEAKKSTLSALHGRLRSPELLSLLAHDEPSVASAAVAGAKLDDEEWERVIPTLPSAARGFLRNRSDLGPKATRTLRDWQSADFRLGSETEQAEVAAPSEQEPASAPAEITESTEPPVASAEAAAPSQPVIERTGDFANAGNLLARIEEFKRLRDQSETLPLPLEGGKANLPESSLDGFAFETDENGWIVWTDAEPRSAVIGMSIVKPVGGRRIPEENSASARFRHRMPIDGATLDLGESQVIAGRWRLDASPFFDGPTGRFRGYRGMLRRPSKVAASAAPDTSDDTLDTQQVLHELRTPLGAIIGFSEIIEQQLFGPVSREYRSLASSILQDARQLLAGLDDVQMSYRSDDTSSRSGETTSSSRDLLETIAARLAPLSDRREVAVTLLPVHPLRDIGIAAEDAERMVSRLLTALIVASEPQEALRATMRTQIGPKPLNWLDVSLPQSLSNRTEQQMLEADIRHEQVSDAPLLGVGFSLRLVRNLARRAGGDLRFEKGHALLSLPAVRETAKIVGDE